MSHLLGCWNLIKAFHWNGIFVTGLNFLLYPTIRLALSSLKKRFLFLKSYKFSSYLSRFILSLIFSLNTPLKLPSILQNFSYTSGLHLIKCNYVTFCHCFIPNCIMYTCRVSQNLLCEKDEDGNLPCTFIVPGTLVSYLIFIATP